VAVTVAAAVEAAAAAEEAAAVADSTEGTTTNSLFAKNKSSARHVAGLFFVQQRLKVSSLSVSSVFLPPCSP
jgi:hypothetical protein